MSEKPVPQCTVVWVRLCLRTFRLRFELGGVQLILLVSSWTCFQDLFPADLLGWPERSQVWSTITRRGFVRMESVFCYMSKFKPLFQIRRSAIGLIVMHFKELLRFFFSTQSVEKVRIFSGVAWDKLLSYFQNNWLAHRAVPIPLKFPQPAPVIPPCWVLIFPPRYKFSNDKWVQEYHLTPPTRRTRRLIRKMVCWSATFFFLYKNNFIRARASNLSKI